MYINVRYVCLLQITCDHRRSSRDPHPSCELCRETADLPLCTPQDTCELCVDLRLDSWNYLLRARRKRMWRKQKREEASCIMADVVANATIGAIRDAAVTIPHTDSVPPSQEEEDMATQDLASASQAEAHFSDVSEASDKPTRVDVESTGVYSSEEESESDFEEMTQLSPVPSLKRSPGFAARDIDFQDFLRYVESHSSFALNSAHNTRPPPTRFASQEEFDEEREETFLALSTSKALVDLSNRRVIDGAESPHANTLGFIPPSGLTKASVKCYQMGDTCLSQAALTRPAEAPSWMASVAPKSRAYVREMDLVNLEIMHRESLSIHSYMDAYVAAITSDMKGDDDPNPYRLRTLSALANAISEVAKRSVAALHQITLHRRDMSIWYSDIRASMIGRVRHTPFLGATSLFSKEVLKDISDEQRDEDRHSAIAIAVRKGQSRVSTPKTALKRKASAPVTENAPQRKKFKGPAKKPQPPATQQAETPKTPKQLKHR